MSRNIKVEAEAEGYRNIDYSEVGKGSFRDV